MRELDPPYNTGNRDFVYDDAFIDKEDGFRHSKWISFMADRLKIAWNLLSPSGILFISINDGEYAGLKLLCDELFSENSYLTTFIWKSRQRADSRNENMISSDHEYILAYGKSALSVFSGKDKDTTKYKNPDNDPRGPWASIDLSGLADAKARPNLHYDIIDPITGNIYPPNPNRGWSKSKENVERMIQEGRILWPASPKGRPREKKFLRDLLSDKTGFSSVLDSESVGFTTDGTRSLMKVLGKKAFSFPKSTKLLMTMIKQIPKDDATVLDFFAGSGTTAQAVLELNRQDGGNRKFILCTNNENNLCEEVTYPRIQTVITGRRQDGSAYAEGIPANLKYFKTEFVPKASEDLSEELLAHIAEMIELEHGIKLDGTEYLMILSDEEADALEANWQNYTDLKGIYLSSEVLLTTTQNRLFERVSVQRIPDYYFKFDLKEVGEAW